MIKIIKKYLNEIIFLLCAMMLFFLGHSLIYESEGKLFQGPEIINIEKNSAYLQKMSPDIANVTHTFSEALLAEKIRLQSIRKLCKDTGEILLYLSIFQFGVVMISLFLKRSRKA